MEALQSWVSDHKLTTIGKHLLTFKTSLHCSMQKMIILIIITGALWASGIGASLVTYSCKKSPMKPSLRLIHARYSTFFSQKTLA